MGKAERVAGRNFEYRVLELARKTGLQARRVILSGSASEKGDVVVEGFRFECKYRKSGLATIRGWFRKAVKQGLDGIIIGGGGSCPLVVVEANRFFELLAEKNNRKEELSNEGDQT